MYSSVSSASSCSAKGGNGKTETVLFLWSKPNPRNNSQVLRIWLTHWANSLVELISLYTHWGVSYGWMVLILQLISFVLHCGNFRITRYSSVVTFWPSQKYIDSMDLPICPHAISPRSSSSLTSFLPSFLSDTVVQPTMITLESFCITEINCNFHT